MRLTLSFDNGPHPDVTPRVLDVLARHGVRAHFFVLGQLITGPAGRALVERTLAEGHLVGNHSFSHTTPLGDDGRPDAVASEIATTEALLDPLVPGERRFRPFGGGGVIGPHLLSEQAVSYLCKRRYSCVLWNSVPRDWVDPGGWPAAALADLEAHPHALTVLHDTPGACLEQLDAFLGLARSRGVEFSLDLPPGCLPIAGGQIVGDIDSIVRRAGGPSSGGSL